MILRLAAKVGGIRVVWKFLPPTYGASLRASPNSHWKDAAFPQLILLVRSPSYAAKFGGHS